jgi:glycosyltransferase involved in cell wall biosynthesis
MKVIIVAPIDPFASTASGIKSYTLNLILNLTKNGIGSTLLGVTNSKITEKTELDFEFIPVANKRVSGYVFFFHLFKTLLFLNIDKNVIIHAQRPDYILPFILLHRKNPKICTLHGAHIKNVSLKKGPILGYLYEHIERYVFLHIDKVITISSETHNYYCKKYPFLKEKSITIPNGVNINIFKPLPDNNTAKEYEILSKEKVILYVGRLEKEKRVDFIIEIFKNLKNTHSDLKLMIVGNGREKESLQTLVKQMSLTDIIFIESLSYEEVPRIMNCADLLIMCSLHEGMPTVVLEALACGLPVVSTDVGDLNHIISSETGCIFKTEEIKDIKDSISDILLNNRISKNSCIETAKNYSWDRVCKSIIGVYYEVLEKE